MNSIRKLIIGATLLVASIGTFTPPAARAQKAGQYSVISSNALAATTTNTSLAFVQTVSEFDNVGVHVTAIPKTTGAGNFVLLGYKSGDGGVSFESSPSITIGTSLANGTNILFTNITIQGVSHIKWVPGSSSADYVTNQVTTTLKSPKFGARQSSQ